MVNKDFDLTKINTFPKLLDYLRVKLDWPIKDENLDDLTFEYSPDELGITDEHHININGIQQLRPLSNNQPWGIFFIDFESKKLPIVLLRRLLSALVPKNRASSQSSSQPTWILDDLLFVSLLGEEKNRQVCFSHFKETEKGLPVLQTFSWDETETHFYYLKKFNLGSLRWPSDINNSERWKDNWSSAFTSSHGQVIKNSKDLSVELAKIAKSIRHTVNEIYKYESDNGHYHKLLGMFKEALIHDLEPDDFSDMVAQTVTYGLFSAATTGEKLTGLSNLSDLIPNTNPFLKNLFDELTTISTTKQNVNFDELGLNDLLDILNETNMDAIMQQFGRQTGGGSEDPVIHFYEDFLQEYDNQEKVEKGVFYTPKPVVSFMVRSVHELIINEYGLEDGLADTSTWVEAVKKNPGLKKPPHARLDDPFIQILDPAVGTGTFLVEVIDIIYNTKISKWRKTGKTKEEIDDDWTDYVNMHLIPRIYGFELMMAPYSIAHVKLGLKLKETGFNLKDAKKRFNIFLTNTLEKPEDLETALFKPFIAIESDEANKVKMNFPITIIIGNPPYSHKSQSLSTNQRKIIEPYRYVDGKKIKERGALMFERNLQDDYVKFIRFCEMKISESNYGITSLITNHSYISSKTLKGMRENLINSYSKIFIIDLHGNLSSKEIGPEKIDEQNIFDIQQGVAISIFAKSTKQDKEIFHADLWGLRQHKNNLLIKSDYSIAKTKVVPKSPDYFFYPRNEKFLDSYNRGIKLTDLFLLRGSGITTNRDKLTIGFENKEIEGRFKIFLSKDYSDIEVLDQLHFKENSIWAVSKARENMLSVYKEDLIIDIDYRPFDKRKIIYHKYVVQSPRNPLMKHIINENNIVLNVCRQQYKPGFKHAFISSIIFDEGLVSNKSREKTVGFPIYLYSNEWGNKKYALNIDNYVMQKINNHLYKNDGDNDNLVKGIEIIDYIYSILHSELYRKNFEELLKTGFPRIPFTKNKRVFDSFVALGGELRKIHLLKNQKVDQFINTYPINGDNTVVKPEYNEGRVFINKDQYFDRVPQLAWDFYIGGYQPAQKWLKDRRARELSKEDIEHYQKIIVALTETDRIMKEIDKVYPEVEKDLIEFKLDDLEKKEVKKAKPDKNQKIFDLIKKGEGQKIEFKATLQKSIDNPNIPPTVIENNVIKSIVGFCNTEGGNLLIGVSDNGDIIGIEQDNFQSNDKFKNHLKNILNARVTKSVFSYIKTKSFKIENRTVFIIGCNKSDVPIFVNYEGVNHFYKRNLESTDSLNPQETLEYCKNRFK